MVASLLFWRSRFGRTFYAGLAKKPKRYLIKLTRSNQIEPLALL
jgi:hypothetical protein